MTQGLTLPLYLGKSIETVCKLGRLAYATIIANPAGAMAEERRISFERDKPCPHSIAPHVDQRLL
jgi:hypothetical protein